MSTFSCPLVRISGFGKHKNADTLCITHVEGSTCIFKEGTFQEGDLAVFVPIEAVVPLDNPAFAWLRDPKKPNKTTHRVKARYVRGVFSDGFLVPLSEIPQVESFELDAVESADREIPWRVVGSHDDPPGESLRLGQDMAPLLGVTKAVDQLPPTLNAEQEYGPVDRVPVYDMEALKKYRYIFEDPSERVIVTEKCHGMNSRFVYTEGRLWVGSRNRFIRDNGRNVYWNAAHEHKLEEKLAQYPNLVLFGEVYGVQDLRYGCEPGKSKFAAFDIYDIAERRYLSYEDFKATCAKLDVPTVPVLYDGPYTSFEHMDSFANPPTEDGKPLMSALDPNTLREGAVIKPAVERWNQYTHRTLFKHVARAYLTRKGGSELQ